MTTKGEWEGRSPNPHAPSIPQKMECAPCMCTQTDHFVTPGAMRRSVGNWGWGGIATKGEWKGARGPSGMAVEVVLLRPQRSHP